MAAWVSWLWCQPVRYALKAAALSAAAVVVTPYLFIYDLTVLSVPVAFLVRDGMEQGFLPGERTLLAILTLALLALYDEPVGTPLALLLLLLVALRICKDPNHRPATSPLVAPPERP